MESYGCKQKETNPKQRPHSYQTEVFKLNSIFISMAKQENTKNDESMGGRRHRTDR